MKRFSLIIFIFFINLTLSGQTEAACTQIVSGEVRDGISTDVLVGAEVILTNGSGAIVETQTIKEDGAFSFTIKCETAYKIEGIQEDYTAESKSFTTTNEDEKELKLIILLDKGNIDFVTDGQANARAIDTIAKAEVVIAEVKPEIVVENIEQPVVATKDVLPKVVPKVVPKKIIKTSTEASAVNIAPVYFDYESSWLNQKAKSDLTKVIDMLKQYPQMVLKCGGYTDAKGEVEYNQWMSNRRAKRVIDYILEGGISASRISGKGFGETKLINDCTNEKECTDKERAINRRTEFVIVKM